MFEVKSIEIWNQLSVCQWIQKIFSVSEEKFHFHVKPQRSKIESHLTFFIQFRYYNLKKKHCFKIYRKVHRKKRLSTHSLIVLKKIDQCQSHFFRLFISAFKLSCCACNIKEWKLCQIETWFLHFPPDLLWQFRMNDLGLQQQFFLILHWNKK